MKLHWGLGFLLVIFIFSNNSLHGDEVSCDDIENNLSVCWKVEDINANGALHVFAMHIDNDGVANDNETGTFKGTFKVIEGTDVYSGEISSGWCRCIHAKPADHHVLRVGARGTVAHANGTGERTVGVDGWLVIIDGENGPEKRLIARYWTTSAKGDKISLTCELRGNGPCNPDEEILIEGSAP